jgi:hypothetical protein
MSVAFTVPAAKLPTVKQEVQLPTKSSEIKNVAQYDLKVDQNITELLSYVNDEQTRILAELKESQIKLKENELKIIENSIHATKQCVEKQEEIPRQSILFELQKNAKTQHYVKASIDFLSSGFDKTLLKHRLQQMEDLYASVKLKNKTERSRWDAYNSLFDLSSTTAKPLKKNHCEKCDYPLTANKKQALLQCAQCARATEQLIPLTSPHHMNHSAAQTLQARMAALGGQKINPQDAKRSKAVHMKLQQFRVGQAPIPAELLIQVKDRLRKKEHINAAFVALPTPVGDALKYLKQEQYLSCKDKIANMINGVVIEELTDAQINEITSRLKVVQMMFRYLRNDVQDHIYINFFVNRICNMLGWKNLAALFPTQRTSSTLKGHMDMWRTLVSFLQCFDSNFQWHEGY